MFAFELWHCFVRAQYVRRNCHACYEIHHEQQQQSYLMVRMVIVMRIAAIVSTRLAGNGIVLQPRGGVVALAVFVHCTCVGAEGEGQGCEEDGGELHLAVRWSGWMSR
jgi:hypothetical protein